MRSEQVTQDENGPPQSCPRAESNTVSTIHSPLRVPSTVHLAQPVPGCLAGEANRAMIVALGGPAPWDPQMRSFHCIHRVPRLLSVALFLTSLPAHAQMPQEAGAPASDVSNIPKPVISTVDSINMRNGPNAARVPKKSPEANDSCLLPRLTWVTSPIIDAEQLKIGAKARQEYQQACEASRITSPTISRSLSPSWLYHLPSRSSLLESLRPGGCFRVLDRSNQRRIAGLKLYRSNK
jgi:hypothetical protein